MSLDLALVEGIRVHPDDVTAVYGRCYLDSVQVNIQMRGHTDDLYVTVEVETGNDVASVEQCQQAVEDVYQQLRVGGRVDDAEAKLARVEKVIVAFETLAGALSGLTEAEMDAAGVDLLNSVVSDLRRALPKP